MKEIELKDLRKRREKHFLQKDGNVVAILFDDDVHFLKNNKYEEIDNTLVKENNYYYNKNNEYKASFSENSLNELMMIQIKNHYIKIKLNDSNEALLKISSNDSRYIQNVKYENVYDGIDFEYVIMPTKVKENIIIKNQSSIRNKINFIIETDMDLILKDNELIALSDNKIIFKIDIPYMVDSNGIKNNNLYYNLKKNNEYYDLCLTIDTKWLNHSYIKYPVVIDPTITNQGQSNSVIDTYIYPGDTGIDRNNQDILKVGVERSNGQDVINRSLIRFDLPTIGTGSQVIWAELNLIGYPILDGSDSSEIITVHRITQEWNETDANWSLMNDKYDSRIEAAFDSRRSTMDSTGYITNVYRCVAEITNLVKKWYSGQDNFGIMLKANKEIYNTDVVSAFFSKNNTITGANPKPILSIVYRNQNGLENYMDYKSQIFTKGSTYVNSYNGNLTGIFNVGKTIGGKFPADLKLVYNTNDVVLNNDVGLGKGYKFSLQQTLKDVVIDEINYIEYVDEDGTIHYFKEIDGIWKDEDGLDLIIEKTSSEYTIKDKNENIMKFTLINSIGYLTEIRDVSGNSITIELNLDKTISKITDANNAEINITYETNRIIITCPDEIIYLNYSNGILNNITSKTGITEILYNNNDIISSIVDENGLKKSYEYYDQIPYRVKKVSEYSIDNSLGNYYNIHYNFNSTTIVDNKNKVITMTFNNYGNIESISNLDSNADLNSAYGRYEKYGETFNGNNGEDFRYKNKLLNIEIPNSYVKNHLTNTSFEDSTINFSASNDINLSISNEEAETGFKSLKAVSSAINQTLSQSVSITKGKYYTFSAYIKNTNKVKISLAYINSLNELVEVFETVESNTEFNRYDVTINYVEDASSDLFIKIYLDEIGVTYIDDIQLEEGEVANNYNLLENSDFNNGIGNWDLESYDYFSDNQLPTSDKFEVVTLNNGVKALKVKMNPAYTTEFSKRFNISGKAGDTYTISFWYKNEGFIADNYVGGKIFNTVSIMYNPVEDEGMGAVLSKGFNPNDNEWQYFSQSFVAEYDFNYILLRFMQMYNANNFYITNMCLFKDLRTQSFDYDANGNIILSKGLNNEVNNFNYDKNNQLIKMTNPKGKYLTYEYDNIVTDRIISGISGANVSNKVEYDMFGNPILTKIINNNVDNIENGIYQIRLKGTNKYLRFINNLLVIKEDTFGLDKWNIELDGENYKIYHSILRNKYLTVSNNNLSLTNYNQDNSQFIIKRNLNGSYSIKCKVLDKYLKVIENSLELSDFIDNDYHFEFYIESIEHKIFIENNAEYSDDGKYINNTIDSLLNETIYDINSVNGLTNSITNAKGRKIRYEYNNKNQLIKIYDSDKVISFNYNERNLLSNIKHGNKEYNFDYDNFFNTRQIKIGENIVLVTNSFENNNGNLMSSIYGNNHFINYNYDELGRIKTIIKMNDVYNYKYGNNGSLIKILSDNYNIKYNYDLAKRLIEYRFNNFIVKYNYDINNNITNIKYNLDNVKHEVINTYDNDDSIKKILFDNKQINYNYDFLGRRIDSNIDNKLDIQYIYLTNGNRTSFIIKSIRINDDLYSYKYDKLNNITHIYFNNKLIIKYFYDNYQQLIKELNYHTNQIVKYKYDNSGNIIRKYVFNLRNNNLLHEYKYEYNNALWEDQLTKVNGKLISYDEIGNPLTIGNDITLNWINGRQLNSYIDPNNNITYKYNKEDIRISKIVNNIETKYYLEGNRIVIEKTGNDVLYYIRDDIGNIIAFKYNSDFYYFIKNVQNDIIGIMNESGVVVVNYEYDSWGKIISITDSNNNDITNLSNHIGNINPFRYRSYYYDKETNLYYLNSRYYNPEWGRFINADSIIGPNNDIFGYNLYLYCGNNPINNFDVHGTKKKTIASVFVKAAKCVNDAFIQVVKTIPEVRKYAATVYSESGGQNKKTKQVVAHSIKNRVNYNQWKNKSTIEEVISQPHQYDGYNNQRYQNAMHYYETNESPKSLAEKDAMDESLDVVVPIYLGIEKDFTDNVVYFHSFKRPEDWKYNDDFKLVSIEGTQGFWWYKVKD